MDKFANQITNQWKKVVNKLSPIEISIQAATTHKTSWGPTTEDMDKIIQLLPSDRDRGIRYIFSTMNDPKSDWRTVYKCLIMIEYFILNADEQSLGYFRNQIQEVRRMQSYSFRDDDGTDKGINVRKRAEAVAESLEDPEINQKRSENQSNKSRYTQAVGSGFSGGYQPQQNSYQQPQYQDSYQQSYQPQQNSYQPQQNAYQPAQNQYAPAQNQYAPAQNQYAPAQNQYAPPQNQYAPVQPAQNQYAPIQPAQNQYAPAQNQYAPQQQFAPQNAQNQQFAPQQPQNQQNQFQPQQQQQQFAPQQQFQQQLQFAPVQPQQQMQAAPQQQSTNNVLDDLLDF